VGIRHFDESWYLCLNEIDKDTYAWPFDMWEDMLQRLHSLVVFLVGQSISLMI